MSRRRSSPRLKGPLASSPVNASRTRVRSGARVYREETMMADAPAMHEVLGADAPSNWGKWGPQDELGSLNYLDAREVLRGRAAGPHWRGVHAAGSDGPQGKPR